MRPFVVAPSSSFRRGRRLAGIALQPPGHIVMEKLFAPDHAGERLPVNEPMILGEAFLHAAIEGVRFQTAPLDQVVEAFEGIGVDVG